MRKSQEIRRIITDIVCLGLICVPWLIIHLIAVPFHRGFFCDDESISHPYKDSTITTLVLTTVGLGLPILCFLITEGIQFARHQQSYSKYPRYSIGETSIPFLIYQYYKVIGVFLFGAAFQQTVVNIGKVSIGRLRPHFFDVCAPNHSTFNCTNSRGFMMYVDTDVCTGTDEEKLLEMRLSFPSGHASFSAYSAVYLALYLHARLTWKGSIMLRPLLQSIALMMAIYCSLSRVSDYKHHWSDVLAGAFFGIIIGCVTVIHFAKLYRPKLEQVNTSNNNLRSISRITYLTDDVTPPGDPTPNYRSYDTCQP